MTSRSELEVFHDAASMFAELCQQVDATQWDLPGLGEWNVRALTGHALRAVTTVAMYLEHPPPAQIACHSAGEYFVLVRAVPGADDLAVAERGHDAGRTLGPDPAAVVCEAVADTRHKLAAVTAAELDDLVMATVVGGMRLNDYLPTRTFELLVHSHDIAHATHQDLVVPAAVTESVLRTAVSAMARLSDGGGLLKHLLGRPGGTIQPMFG